MIFNLENRRTRFPEDNAIVQSTLGYLYALDGRQQEALEIADSLELQGEFMTSRIHIALGNHQKALEILEKSIDQRQFYVLYIIKMAPEFDPIRENPKFKELLDRMGLLNTHL
jgi:tetratricopeptide (TPR) repeat protein